jgi:hypothetical protein
LDSATRTEDGVSMTRPVYRCQNCRRVQFESASGKCCQCRKPMNQRVPDIGAYPEVEVIDGSEKVNVAEVARQHGVSWSAMYSMTPARFLVGSENARALYVGLAAKARRNK